MVRILLPALPDGEARMFKALRWILPVLAIIPLAAPPARAVDPQEVKKGIDKAKFFLKSQYGGHGGVGPGDSYAEGPAALAGLALLLSGEKRDDPAVQSIAAKVREAAINQNSTYHLAL